MVSPHGMDPQTVLRFVKTVGGWPGKVVVVACEPASGEDMGLELSPEVAAAVERAVDLVVETIAELRSSEAYARQRLCTSSRSRARSSTRRCATPAAGG